MNLDNMANEPYELRQNSAQLRNAHTEERRIGWLMRGAGLFFAGFFLLFLGDDIGELLTEKSLLIICASLCLMVAQLVNRLGSKVDQEILQLELQRIDLEIELKRQVD